jgi:molecular chaperone HscB
MQSYFTLFDLEPRFALAVPQLEHAYRALVARVHPDRHVQAPAAERVQALSQATQANDAYRTLKRPALRAKHLLGLRGMDVGASRMAMATDFLLEQMDWREQLEESQAARSRELLASLATTVQARAAALMQQLEEQLDRERNDDAAMQSVQQLMFIDKLLADVDDARERLGD